MTQGNEVLDERKSKTKEILNVMWTITRPEDSKVPDAYPLKEESMKVYENQFTDPEKHTFVYTYGNRLRKHFVVADGRDGPIYVDQLSMVGNRLRCNPNSRRATMVTYDPTLDLYDDEIPCFIMGDFKIREGKLYTTGVWRSHDAFGAIPANFFALLKMAKDVAKCNKVEVGPITVQSVSAHVYEINWTDAKRAAKFMG